MATTEKISVAIGRDELHLARVAADQEGISLSAYVTRAVRDRLVERKRTEAAREVLATFAPSDFPTAEEADALVALWMRPRVSAPSRAKRNARKARRAA